MNLENNVLFAFILTLFAGLSTGIGSLMAFLSKEFNHKFLDKKTIKPILLDINQQNKVKIKANNALFLEFIKYSSLFVINNFNILKITPTFIFKINRKV